MESSPIFVKTYAMLRWLLPQTVKFPKAQRFLLAKRIEDAALDFHERIVRAGRPGSSARGLREADIELTKLRLYLRLAADLHLMSVGQYEHVARMVNEIGKLLGGWVRKRGGGPQEHTRAGDVLPA